tara:strand:+ start:1865 stop:4114 length:2250 start_codon:yes stop_codon:yes gene_type:complete
MFRSFKNSLYLIFFLIFFTCLSASYAEKIKLIEVNGNNRISKETILIFSEVKMGQEVDNIVLNNLLKNLYETNYFKNVSTVIKSGKLTISVEENPLIGNLDFKGIKAKKILKSLKDNISLKPRSSYNDLSLKNDKQTIYKILKDLGYYFPKVDILLENKPNNIVDIFYTINLGEKTKISKIIFNGNYNFKVNKLRSIIVSEEYKFWKFISGRKYLKESNVNFDKRLLKNFYLNQGFYNAEINSSFAKLDENNNFELTFNVFEGEKFFFDNFDLILPLDYDKNNYSEVLKLFSKFRNKPYSILRIEKLINQIDKISTEEQFVSVKSTVKETLNDNRISLIFEVAETDKVTIKKINFLGNNVTKENVLRNQLEIDEGDPYNDILVVKSINNLKSLNFFKDVTLDVVDVDDSFKELNINIIEKATGEITAGAGVGTSGATISFGVKENNYLGQGVKLQSNVSLTEDSIKGLFSVRNPNYNNSDKSLRASFQATETDKLNDFGYKTSKTGFSFGTDFEYYDDLNFGIGLNTFYESVTADSTASARQKKQVGNYFDIFTNLSFVYDKRDQKFQTTDGSLSRYSVDLPLLSDSNTFSNLYTLTNYHQIFTQNILKSSIYLKASSSIGSNSVKLSERNYIPSSRLRGFEYGKVGPKDGDDFIGGNYIAALSFSSTVPQILENTQSTDFSVFLDIANTWGVDYDSSLDTSDDIRSSIGVGLDWFSPIGPVNFTLAQPLSKSDNDVTETFRFNLGTTF